MEKNPRRRNCSDDTRHSHGTEDVRLRSAAAHEETFKNSARVDGELEFDRLTADLAIFDVGRSGAAGIHERVEALRRSRDIGCCGTLASSPAPHPAQTLARTRVPDRRRRRYRLRPAGSSRGLATVENSGASWTLGLLFRGARYLNALRVLVSDANRRQRGGTQARDLRIFLYTLAARALA